MTKKEIEKLKSSHIGMQVIIKLLLSYTKDNGQVLGLKLRKQEPLKH